MIDERNGLALILGKLSEGSRNVELQFTSGDAVLGIRQRDAGLLFHRKGHGRTGAASAHAIEAGVHDDSVQPGRDLGVTTELRGTAVGGDQRILQGIGSVLRVTGGLESHGPQSISVTAHDLGEGIRVPGDVGREQLAVAG